MSQMIDPSRIFAVGEGFMASKTLLSAVELDLFTHLGTGPMTAAQIATALGLHPRAVPDFPDCLVALEFLERDGDGPDAHYRNTSATATFLDTASPAYVGGLLSMLNSRLYGFWGDLTEGLRTGQPQSETKHTGRPLFDELSRDPDRLRQFVAAMTAVSRGGFQTLAEVFDFARYRTVLDVGGADGQLSLILAARHGHLRCTTFDLPQLEPLAKEAIASAGLDDRVQAVSGDFFSGALPEADVITMSLVLHDWNLERKLHLIDAAYAALPPGGALVVVEALIDDARRSDALALLISLNMLVEFGDAFGFTGEDFRGWCIDAGFERVEILPLIAGWATAAVAYK